MSDLVLQKARELVEACLEAHRASDKAQVVKLSFRLSSLGFEEPHASQLSHRDVVIDVRYVVPNNNEV